jgi:hypothetical protein
VETHANLTATAAAATAAGGRRRRSMGRRTDSTLFSLTRGMFFGRIDSTLRRLPFCIRSRCHFFFQCRRKLPPASVRRIGPDRSRSPVGSDGRQRARGHGFRLTPPRIGRGRIGEDTFRRIQGKRATSGRTEGAFVGSTRHVAETATSAHTRTLVRRNERRRQRGASAASLRQLVRRGLRSENICFSQLLLPYVYSRSAGRSVDWSSSSSERGRSEFVSPMIRSQRAALALDSLHASGAPCCQLQDSGGGGWARPLLLSTATCKGRKGGKTKRHDVMTS